MDHIYEQAEALLNQGPSRPGQIAIEACFVAYEDGFRHGFNKGYVQGVISGAVITASAIYCGVSVYQYAKLVKKTKNFKEQ